MKTKRGLNEIVSTVLIIIVAILALLLIWTFFKPTISNSFGQLNSTLNNVQNAANGVNQTSPFGTSSQTGSGTALVQTIPANAVYINGCTNLNSQGTYYVLNKSLNIIGSCFSITANNIIFDGNGNTITGNLTNSGVSASNVKNISIKNLSVSGFNTGIAFNSVINSSVLNCNVILNTFWGINILSSSGNNFINISGTGNGFLRVPLGSFGGCLLAGSGHIFITGSNYNNFSGLNFGSGSGCAYNSMILYGSSSNSIINSNLGPLGVSLSRDFTGPIINDTFLNTTMNANSAVVGTQFIRQWYFTLNVKDQNNVAISGANITIKDANGNVVALLLTDSNGNIPLQILTDYITNGSLVNYSSPYNITVSNSGYATSSIIVNPSNTFYLPIILTLSTIPSAPTNLHASTPQGGGILLNWNPSTGATSYNIYRSLTNGGGFAIIGTNNSNSYIDKSATPNTPYWYQVTAVNSAGESLPSNAISASYTVGYTINSCQNINSPGVYNLGANFINVFVTNNYSCIFINSSNVILNGNGYIMNNISNNKNIPSYVNYLDDSLFYGVVFEFNVTNVTINNLNIINSSGPAIRDFYGNGNLITNNTLTNNVIGISSYQMQNSNITNNKLYNHSQNSIELESEGTFFPGINDNNMISGNYISTNWGSSATGISGSALVNGKVINNTLYATNGAGTGINVGYWPAIGNIVSYNSVTGFSSYGIDDTSDSDIVSWNNVTGGAVGIYSSGASTSVNNNRIKSVNTGIRTNGHNALFTLNNVTGASAVGAYIDNYAHDNSFTNNYICSGAANDFYCTNASAVNSGSANRFSTRSGCAWADTGKIAC